jgi:hypothetical protein
MDILSTFTLNRGDDDLAMYALMRLQQERQHAHVVCHRFKGTPTRATLPERARVLATVEHGEQRSEVVAELDGTVLLLRVWGSGGWACVTAHAADAAHAVVRELVDRVPTVDEPRKVRVSFTDAKTGSRSVSLDVLPWAEVEGNYAPDVASAMTDLLAHRPDPAGSRRLLLWHGAPGTGKTSAIRALLHGGRDWADGVVVTDPEVLLSSGAYLRDVVLDADDDERWQLVVLEDAEDLLHKGRGGAALGKLLNLCDGLLGQGLRCLFLITTNEPLHAVHPALVRPGRCLARVEFGALPAAQAARLLGRPVDRDLTLAEVMAATPLQVVQDAVAVGQYL